jgi:preprotein translocase subunit SecE
VAWPTRAEVVQHAGLCFAFLVLLAVLLASLDIAYANLVGSLMSRN